MQVAASPPPLNRCIRIPMLLCSGIVILFFLRNLLFKNYVDETKTFLTKAGRKDAIDQIFPPTITEKLKITLRERATHEELVANVTMLSNSYKNLRRDMDHVMSVLAAKEK